MRALLLPILALTILARNVEGQEPAPVGGGGLLGRTAQFQDPLAPVGGGGLIGLREGPVFAPVGHSGLGDEVFARNVAVFGSAPSSATILDHLETLAITLNPDAKEVSKSGFQSVGTFSATREDLEIGLSKIDTATYICTPRTGIPTTTWREALVQARSLKACDDAVRPLVEARRNPSYFSFLSGGSSVGTDFEILKALFSAYKSSCLQMLSDFEDRTAFKELFGEQFSSELRVNVGTLIGRDRQAGQSFPCMASIVRTGEGGKSLALVTAAHCIGARRSNGNGLDQILSAFDSLEFTSLAGQTVNVNIDPDVRGWTYPTGNDLAVIPLASEWGEGGPNGLRVASSLSLGPWEPLYLFGVNPIAIAVSRAENKRAEVLAEEAVTISLGAPCRIYGVVDGQMLHNCETEKQMSGSPIFLIEGDSARIAAVHTGGDSDAPQACEPGTLPAVNRAVLLTATPTRG